MNKPGFRMFKQESKAKPDNEMGEPNESPAEEKAEENPVMMHNSKKRTMVRETKKKNKY